MTGHVIYACQCLNIRIHLAHKYYLEGHEKYRREKFVRLTEYGISGWLFELGAKGVTVEYTSLIHTNYDCTVQDPSSWTTISCYNCNIGDVYSVKNNLGIKLSDPTTNDLSSLGRIGDYIIIHQGSIFGKGIENLQKKTTYSNIFHIILNPDLPVNHASLDKDEGVLISQQKHIQRILKQSLLELEGATEKRIEAYKQEQHLLLRREKEKAMYDSTILWQTMKVIANTIREEKRLLQNVNQLQQPRKSSILDLFTATTTNRKFSLEGLIANTRKEPLGPINELPPFQRRSSLVAPPNQHNLHPLTVALTQDTNMTLPSSKNTGSWLEDPMFTLDEEIDTNKGQGKRRQSIKYTGNDEGHSVSSKVTPALRPGKNEISQNTSVHPSSSLIEPTSIEERKRKPSFIGFDCSEVDRQVSSELETEITKKESLDDTSIDDNNHTRHNKSSNLPEEEQDPSITPPHMFVLGTEKENLFGSVPRKKSIRNKPTD